MLEIFALVLEQFPSFMGLVVLAYYLVRQNTKLLDQLFDEIRAVQIRLDQMERLLDEIKNP